MSLEYWDHEFKTRAGAHQEQNRQISEDFIRRANARATFSAEIRSATSILELGCGTGEMLTALRSANEDAVLVGVDPSANAINTARSGIGQKHRMTFLVGDDNDIAGSNVDLGIVSNVLEHFREPFVVLDKLVAVSRRTIVLVPYRQPCTDGYDHEGGAGHVYTFSEHSFDRDQYHVIDWFLFQTAGWQHSSKGETPMQLAILLRKESTPP